MYKGVEMRLDIGDRLGVSGVFNVDDSATSSSMSSLSDKLSDKLSDTNCGAQLSYHTSHNIRSR